MIFCWINFIKIITLKANWWKLWRLNLICSYACKTLEFHYVIFSKINWKLLGAFDNEIPVYFYTKYERMSAQDLLHKHTKIFPILTSTFQLLRKQRNLKHFFLFQSMYFAYNFNENVFQQKTRVRAVSYDWPWSWKLFTFLSWDFFSFQRSFLLK